MLESYKNNRIKFNKNGVQKKFIAKVMELSGLTKSQLAKRLNVSPRTLADWAREKITITETSAQVMSKLANLSIPKDHFVIDWKTRFQNAGKIGGRNKFMKYGKVSVDEKYRKERWEKWWVNIGKYKQPSRGFKTILRIKVPRKSKLLAEFIGILLGDGNISKYQIGITLSIKEKQYIKYVCTAIEKLFGVVPTVLKHKRSEAVTIVVSRKLLVDFCQKFGFKMGNKVAHQVDIPSWIKENKTFSRECLRGLVDTDGCFFNHDYIVGGKIYSYFKIAFTSASVPLINSMARTLINFGINARISKNHKDVRIESAKYVDRYIDEVGSHNEKHLQKIKKWKKSQNMLE